MEENREKQIPIVQSRQDDEMEIDLKEVFYLLVSHWKSILLAALLGAAVFGAYHTFLLKPSYQADASIYITSTDSMISFSDLQLSAALTDDYANIIKSRTVLNRVIDELDLNLDYKQLGALVSVDNPDSTHIVDIKVTCDDPELSRNITNALMNISVDQIYQVIGSGEPTVIDYAMAEAVQDVTPGLKKYLMLGGLLGALIVCAIVVLRMLMDTTMKTVDDIDRYLHLPVLAAVPYYREMDRK
ncbi:MAG: Wzz/FepE/Etk N-terminal domain-containing protein [Lachnospiraceae bacterium]|nr:Wzz/FepE/Etk N-terminal domain-containing protein [Lachnospiraceae bacterium]